MIRRLTHSFAVLALLVPIGLTVDASTIRAQAPVATQAGQVALPDSPAGRALKAWLEAFNSGDAAKMDAYYQKYEPMKSAEGQMGFRDETGGFDLLGIEKNEPLHIEFLVKEKKGVRTAVGALDVSAGESGGVKNLILLAVPKGGSVADFRIDGAERTRVIEGAIAKLNESYVFPEKAVEADAVMSS